MPRFGADEIPPSCDLRRRGWERAEAVLRCESGSEGYPMLAQYAAIGPAEWIALFGPDGQAARELTLLLGINQPERRAGLLRLGFGEVVPSGALIGEIETRAARIEARVNSLPRTLKAGGLRLELMAREAYAGSCALGLHPREFALLWRLAETPGRPVGKAELWADVWRGTFVPETNSLAVHVSRLRAKLAIAGLRDMVATTASGAYLLTRHVGEAVPPAAGQALKEAIS